jgi:hypothetical protein
MTTPVLGQLNFLEKRDAWPLARLVGSTPAKVKKCADRQKGRFRAFLLASLKNFFADASDRQRTLKRGGAQNFLRLHEAQAIEAMINRAISIYESLFSDPITIQFLFRYSTTAPDGSPLPQGTVSRSDLVI